MTIHTLPRDPSPEALRTARHQNPRARARDLATTLGVSEGQLVAAGVNGETVVRLICDIDRLFPAIRTLGPVLALTRNEHCVHERDGTYLDYHPGVHAAMVLGPDIDLRMFPRHWVHAFALAEGDKRSIQVFDAAGDAVHKVHLRPASSIAAFDQLVAGLRSEDQSDGIAVATRTPVEGARSTPDKVDILRKEWDALTDTHQFLRLTAKVRMNRLGAYRIAGAPYVHALQPEALAEALRQCAAQQIPVMLFVGNTGCIQIHGGPIHRVEPMGPWLNVLDPGFNLHLRADTVAEVWLVWKPTRQGAAISIEAFDAEGGLILQLFGKRDPDTARWDALTEVLRDTLGA
ncbi:MAG: hemin-degrading factor [Rhodobacter sp.]|nr:hemin-degrading factor [Paracoccaceae bacterium]MCC0076510.1 hemin-degrading factor [Rhodobacter sp.]